MAVAAQRHRFTVREYRRMAEAGILHPDCRVELVDGEIYEMTPIDPWHAGVVRWLTHRFITALGDRAVVDAQNPVDADPRSEPQPDIALLEPRADFYRTAHPRSEQALLLIEVANTSLRHDRGRKLPLYTRAGIPEHWIVNRQADAVEVYRDPSRRGYREHATLERGQLVAPSAFPEVQLLVDEILG